MWPRLSLRRSSLPMFRRTSRDRVRSDRTRRRPRVEGLGARQLWSWARSPTLPVDANVEVLAATLVPAGTSQQVDLSAAFNRTGIVADGTPFSGGGLDGAGYALSANL